LENGYNIGVTSADSHTARERRTNAERTASTRAKLLEATAALLAEVGYARTSTTEISRRAGVSRGAQLHHFPTKVDLVAAAMAYILDRRVEELRAILTTLPEGPDRFDTAIDVLWSMAQGPTFEAWFEMVAAARTDPELRPLMAAVADHLNEIIRQVWAELFPAPEGVDATTDLYATVPMLFFAVLDGLVMQHVAGGSHVHENAQNVLGLVKLLARLVPLAAEPEVQALLASLTADPAAAFLADPLRNPSPLSPKESA
jgi:AcrR family transcriptional regulator